MCYIGRVMVNFLLKFPNFRYHVFWIEHWRGIGSHLLLRCQARRMTPVRAGVVPRAWDLYGAPSLPKSLGLRPRINRLHDRTV